MVPNRLFDECLKDLGYAELKILLAIIRQTYGWKDPRTGGYKQWDWISQKFFVRKTGLSGRAVSTAISKLVHRGYIQIKNGQGKVMFLASERKREPKLYYSCRLELKTSEVNGRKSMK